MKFKPVEMINNYQINRRIGNNSYIFLLKFINFKFKTNSRQHRKFTRLFCYLKGNVIVYCREINLRRLSSSSVKLQRLCERVELRPLPWSASARPRLSAWPHWPRSAERRSGSTASAGSTVPAQVLGWIREGSRQQRDRWSER